MSETSIPPSVAVAVDRSADGVSADGLRARYGVWVVAGGLAVVLAAFLAAALIYSEAADVSTALAPVTGVVGTLVGAYFGLQSGAQGREAAEDRAEGRVARAEAARERAEQDARRLAAVASPELGARVLGVDLQANPAEPSATAAGGRAPTARSTRTTR